MQLAHEVSPSSIVSRPLISCPRDLALRPDGAIYIAEPGPGIARQLFHTLRYRLLADVFSTPIAAAPCAVPTRGQGRDRLTADGQAMRVLA